MMDHKSYIKYVIAIQNRYDLNTRVRVSTYSDA